MSRLLEVLVTTLVVAGLGATQSTDCENTCEPKMLAAVKCQTMDCLCYAYDDPDYVSCLQFECGRGYASVREIQVLVCQGFSVTLSPNPPSGGGTSPQTTTAASNPQATGTGTSTGTSGTTSGAGNGGGSSSTGSGSGSGSGSDSGVTSSQSSGNKLSTAELIGIIIGSVSALATIIGVWVTIKRRRTGRPNQDGSARPAAYHPIAPLAQAYPPVQHYPAPRPVQNFAYNGPPPWNQPPPAYHTVHVSWRK